jgi:hypothetical protein
MVAITVLLAGAHPAGAQYSGGSGTAEDPYRIATAADLIGLGQTPEDYDKHFILTADIDLDPNLPGRQIFTRAPIAPDTEDTEKWFQGSAFTGVFDGDDYTISNLTIVGQDHKGLFGFATSRAVIARIRLEAVNIDGKGAYVGGLAGRNDGTITASHCTGTVIGFSFCGGLVGDNWGTIANCSSGGFVSGRDEIGGLLGWNAEGSVYRSFSSCRVAAHETAGGLLGANHGGSVHSCFSTGTVSGGGNVGGLVGYHADGSISVCFSSAAVLRGGSVGGIVGLSHASSIAMCFSTATIRGGSRSGGILGRNVFRTSTSSCFWDVETSGVSTSEGGTGLTTAKMKDIATYLNGGWDLVDEVANGTCDYWQMSAGQYPQLRWEAGPDPVMPQGLGTAEQPFLIHNARDLGAVVAAPRAYYRLETSLDLSEITWSVAPVPIFAGVFDGNSHTIANLQIHGGGSLGLFGQLHAGAEIFNLGLDTADVNGIGSHVGSLVGYSGPSVGITACYGTGSIRGDSDVGGLAGYSEATIVNSYASCTVSGNGSAAGGVGGLVGTHRGEIANTYAAGPVSGNRNASGLVGYWRGGVANSFWDAQVCDIVEEDLGLSLSLSLGLGKTTAEMNAAATFLRWGTCGNEGIWTIDEGRDYPRLTWQQMPGEPIVVGSTLSEFLTGAGTEDDPYLVYTADELNVIGMIPCDWDKHFALMADINLSRFQYQGAPIAPMENESTSFTGTFEGNGHTISHLAIAGDSCLGLFGGVGFGGKIANLGLHVVDVNGTSGQIGGLVGFNEGGTITNCHVSGTVQGYSMVGGLVGNSEGTVIGSYSAVTVNGRSYAGGLVGHNDVGNPYPQYPGGHDGEGRISASFSTGAVTGRFYTGGLIGMNWRGSADTSYSAAAVTGVHHAGGLVGYNGCATITACYSSGHVTAPESVGGLVGCGGRPETVTASFWDTQTSGQSDSDGGTGLTTAEMQIAQTFLDAGWDFIGETENGADDIWWIREAQDYPRLWWELSSDDGELPR